MAELGSWRLDRIESNRMLHRCVDGMAELGRWRLDRIKADRMLHRCVDGIAELGSWMLDRIESDRMLHRCVDGIADMESWRLDRIELIRSNQIGQELCWDRSADRAGAERADRVCSQIVAVKSKQRATACVS
jgi:hypothetical protein